MSHLGHRGFSLMEVVLALALTGIVLALVGSLFVASLSAWQRGSDLREAQVQANTLVELMARDIRSASQAPGVSVRPRLPVDEGEAILSVAVARSGTAGGPVWVLYLLDLARNAVVRQTVVPGPGGRLLPQDSRVVATGVQRVHVEQAGSGVTIEVTVLRGREVATSRATAAPRNP